jgi:AraC-like DNA-binding protein
LDVPGAADFLAKGNFVQLRDLAVGFGAGSKRAIIRFDETAFARLQFAIKGKAKNESGRATAIVRVGQPCVTSPYRAATLDYGNDFEQIFLRVGTDALERELTAITGLKIGRRIELEPDRFTSRASIYGLEDLLLSFIRSIDDEAITISTVARRELEQAIVVQFLFACRHNYSALLERETMSPGLSQVRLTVEYIDVYWNQPITVKTLAEVSGVSARSLFKAFARVYGCSPMQYVKNVRLEKAHRLLAVADAKQSVTAVAFACAFANLGHFARDYRNRFGELPSQTLSRNLRRM